MVGAMPLAACVPLINHALTPDAGDLYLQAQAAVEEATSIFDAIERFHAATGALADYEGDLAEGRRVLSHLSPEQNALVLDAMRQAFAQNQAMTVDWEEVPEGGDVAARADQVDVLSVVISSPHGRHFPA
jgi:hypothetical protein